MADKKRKSRGASWDEVPPINEGRRFDSELDMFSFSENTHTQVRLVGPIFPLKMHWVPTIKKDGSRGVFPKLCLHNNEEVDVCPYCKAGISVNTRYLTNAIVRDLEESRPRKASFNRDADFKKKGDDNWTPIRVVSFPATVMQKILNFKSLTKVKTKDGIKTFHVSHEKYGRDLNIKLDPSGTGSGMYDVQREAVSRLEGEELEYLLYDIDSAYEVIESEQEVLDVLRSCFERGAFEGAKTKDGKSLIDIQALRALLGIKPKKKSRRDDDLDDDDFYEEDEEKSSRRKSSSKRRKDEDDDLDIEDEDDDLDIEDEDDDLEEETSSRSKKSKASSKKRRRDEDDDDLEEDDDFEEDKKPSRKKSSTKKTSKRRKNDDDDLEEEDEDDDLDDDDFYEEDEEKSSRRKSSSKRRR